MLRFVLRRLAVLLGALFVSSVVIFLALQIGARDPLTTLSGGRSLPPAALENLREQYHLNDGLAAQYWHWLTGALHGELGDSIVLHQSVATVIGERLAMTLELVGLAAFLVAVGGIGLDLLAGLRRGLVDRAIVLGITVAAAIPSFLAAVVLLSVFSVQLGWLPALGAGSGVVGRFEHLILPAVALALSGLAVVARITRVSVREESEKEHVETALGRGLSNRTVIRRHVLRNAARIRDGRPGVVRVPARSRPGSPRASQVRHEDPRKVTVPPVLLMPGEPAFVACCRIGDKRRTPCPGPREGCRDASRTASAPPKHGLPRTAAAPANPRPDRRTAPTRHNEA